MLIIWILIFIATLALLVKSADWLVENAEKIGLALGISPFIIGVTIVAVGTSFPELASSVAATLKGETAIAVANAIGSNIANILLIVGLSAVFAFKMTIRRSLIDLDAPLLASATGLLLFVSWDKKIVFGEGILLLIGFLIYLLYTIFQKREDYNPPTASSHSPEGEWVGETPEIVEVLPSRIERRHKKSLKDIKKEEFKKEKLNFKIFFWLGIGIVGLVFSADWAIESLTKIAEILKIAPPLIAITALAVGTSLPELVVSVGAARKKKYEIALGNVFGSNVFNILMVIGVPALFSSLQIDETTFLVGIPFLLVATLLFVITGISRRIHIWEGAMYLLIYVLFVAKLVGLF
jgi:cation:H+ antiporter